MSNELVTTDVRRKVAEARKKFLTISSERLERAAVILRSGPLASEAKSQLCKILHQLVGASGLYDLGAFCQRSIEAEKLAMDLLYLDDTESGAVVNQLLSIVSDLTGELDHLQSAEAVSEQIPYVRFSDEALARTVLAVGDKDTLSPVTKMIETLGLRIHFADDLAAAVFLIGDNLFDGMIVSTELSDDQPFKLARIFREQLARDGNAPVVFADSNRSFLKKLEAIKAGCDAFFDVAGDFDQLCNKALRLFEKICPPKFKILIVEDDAVQAAALMAFLEQAGFETTILLEAEKFEEVLLATQPDLLILDVMLGDVSGFELAKYVRQDEKFATTPMIFLTAQSELDSQIKGARLGDDYLVKPTPPELLVATIAGRLERYRTINDLLGRDGLTGALNYAEFMRALEHMCSTSETPPAMLVADIDQLKKTNESHGFACGEMVLTGLFEDLKTELRSCGTIGRVGGDEFAVIVEDLSLDELTALSKSICQRVKRREFRGADGRKFTVTVKVGISQYKSDLSVQDWLESALDRNRTKDGVSFL